MELARIRENPAATAATLVALGGIATILGAYFFQYVLGLPPCPLCIEQRIPYYVAIPLACVVALAAWTTGWRPGIVGGLGLLALAMLIGAGLGVYHAGIEWHWWLGPQGCSGTLAPLDAGDLITRIQSERVVRCDEAAWRFLGLSLAGWNVLISLALAAIATWGILASREAAHRPATQTG